VAWLGAAKVLESRSSPPWRRRTSRTSSRRGASAISSLLGPHGEASKEVRALTAHEYGGNRGVKENKTKQESLSFFSSSWPCLRWILSLALVPPVVPVVLQVAYRFVSVLNQQGFIEGSTSPSFDWHPHPHHHHCLGFSSRGWERGREQRGLRWGYGSHLPSRSLPLPPPLPPPDLPC